MEQKNAPPQDYILVEEKRLLDFVDSCFQRASLTPEHAAVIARLLVNSDLRGVRSHGSRNLNGYARGLQNGALNPRPQIRPVHQIAAATVFDGDGTLGYWPMVQAAKQAVVHARQTGLGLGLVRHIGHYGSAGHYARICQEAGCIGFSAQGYRNEGFDRGETPPTSVGYSGDPPFSFAIPGGQKEGVVLDAGANIFGFYNGKEDYQDLLARLPGAFFRSMGLIAVATLLGGALTGFTGPQADAVQQRWAGAGNGGMVLAIDLKQLVEPQQLAAEADRYARDLAAHYAPIPGTDRVQLPGALEAERFERYRRQGIPYGEPEQAAAHAASQHFDVPLPWD